MNDNLCGLRFQFSHLPQVGEVERMPTAEKVAALPLVVPLGPTAKAQPAGIHIGAPFMARSGA